MYTLTALLCFSVGRIYGLESLIFRTTGELQFVLEETKIHAFAYFYLSISGRTALITFGCHN